jgi:hypothetical protein
MNKTKNNWPIVGNEHIVEYLSRCLNKNKIEQTYILEGPRDLGKNTVLKYFIQCLLCSDNLSDRSIPCGQCISCRSFIDKHPDTATEKSQELVMSDLYVLEKLPDKKNISISQIREFTKRLGLSSFMGKYKIGIIKDADTLSTGAANALLKILEEPKKDVLIFLICSNTKFLLPTIVSRSQILRFKTVAASLIYDYLHLIHGARRNQAKYLSHISMGRPALALKFFKNRDFLKNYEEQSTAMFDFFKYDINKRIALVGDIIDAKLRGREAELAVGKVLDIYEGLCRDLTLSINGVQGRFKYIEKQDELGSIARKLGGDRIQRLPQFLKQARKYLHSNVKPQVVLDYLAISL